MKAIFMKAIFIKAIFIKATFMKIVTTVGLGSNSRLEHHITNHKDSPLRGR
jgi:hypothetical protein